MAYVQMELLGHTLTKTNITFAFNKSPFFFYEHLLRVQAFSVLRGRTNDHLTDDNLQVNYFHVETEI